MATLPDSSDPVNPIPEGFKRCTRCGVVQGRVAEFYPAKRSPDGHATYCKTCQRELSKLKYRGLVPHVYKGAMNFFRHCSICDLWKVAATDFYQSKPGQRAPGVCKECHKKNSNARYHANPEKQLSKARERAWQLKLEMIAAYGGRCQCCGVAEPEFLTLDHIGGGGRKHRQENGHSFGVNRKLKAMGWPKDEYRVLCWNCNMSIGFYGYCPHQASEEEAHGVQPYRMDSAKWCIRCGSSKPRTIEFWPSWKGDPWGSLCRPCAAAYQMERYNLRKGKILQPWPEDHETMGVLRQCPKCSLWKTVGNFTRKCLRKSWCDGCAKAAVNRIRRRARVGLRKEVVAAYGGKCACCGESCWQLLSIDHINRDGAVERAVIGSRSEVLYAALKRSGYPSGRHQVLCFNCNCSRGSYGFCPCQRRKPI